MKSSTLTWFVIVLVVLGIGWYFFSGSSAVAPSTQSTTTDTSQTSLVVTASSTGGVSVSITKGVTVTYGPNGFSPKSVTISKGDTVTFVNQGSDRMWVASDPHPTHQGYSGTTKNQHCPDTAGTAFDQCSTGTTYSFTFQKTGTWGYHNHARDEDAGTVIVK